MIYLVNLDLNKNELQNAVIQPLAVAPSSPKLGQVYYNSTDKCLYQYDGTTWKRVGVIYEEESVAGKVLSGLGSDGTVYTTQVKDLQLKGLVPVSGGYVSDGDSLETAIKALDQAVKNAVSGGGEVNQFAFSNVKIGSITITANSKTDTVEFIAGSNVTLTPNASSKTITISVNIPDPDWSQIINKPTKLSEFTNDEGFIDNTVSNLVNYYTKTEVFTKDEVNGLIGNIATISIQVVEGDLPSTGKSNIIYLKAKSTADGETNIYDEYLWTGTKFERIGDTTVDLSNYLTKTGDASNVTATFTSAGSRALPTSGESLSIIIGKVIKYLSDLKTVAFTGSYNDLTGKPTQVVRYATGTISKGSTTSTVSYTGTFVGASIVDSSTKEVVLVDIQVGTNQATFTISEAHTNDLNILVMYS